MRIAFTTTLMELYKTGHCLLYVTPLQSRYKWIIIIETQLPKYFKIKNLDKRADQRESPHLI